MYKVEIAIISISRILVSEVSSASHDTLSVFNKKAVTIDHYYEKQALCVSLPQSSQNPIIVTSVLLLLHLVEPLNTWFVLPASKKFTTGIQIHDYGTPLHQFLGNDEVIRFGSSTYLPTPNMTKCMDSKGAQFAIMYYEVPGSGGMPSEP